MAKEPKFCIQGFLRCYPDEDACLAEVFRLRYGEFDACPGCDKTGAKFYRLGTRRCYESGYNRKLYRWPVPSWR